MNGGRPTPWLNLKQLQALAVELCESWRQEKRVVILLRGEMGAGKTEFVRAWLGAEVVSPTFTLHQMYQHSSGREIMHWDLYRMKNQDEIEGIGFWDQFLQMDYFIFIEWPERLENAKFSSATKLVQIYFEIGDEGQRRLSLS